MMVVMVIMVILNKVAVVVLAPYFLRHNDRVS